MNMCSVSMVLICSITQAGSQCNGHDKDQLSLPISSTISLFFTYPEVDAKRSSYRSYTNSSCISFVDNTLW